MTSSIPGAQSDYSRTVSAYAEFFVGLVATEGPRLNGADVADGGAAQRRSLKTWRTELENIYAVQEMGLRLGRADWLVPIARWLLHYLDMSGSFQDIGQHCARLLAAAQRTGSLPLQLWTQLGLARLQWRLGQHENSGDTAQAALALARQLDERIAEARAQIGMGHASCGLGDYAAARENYVEALGIMQRLADNQGQAACLANLGYTEYSEGNGAAATGYYDRALALFRQLGNRQGEAMSLNGLSNIAHMEHDEASARQFHGESIAILREIGDQYGQATALTNLAFVEDIESKHQAALALLAEAITIWQALGMQVEAVLSCALVSVVLCHLERYEPAARILAASLASVAEIDYHFSADEQENIRDSEQQLTAAADSGLINASDLGRWRAEGAAISLSQLAEFTLSALQETAQPA